MSSTATTLDIEEAKRLALQTYVKAEILSWQHVDTWVEYRIAVRSGDSEPVEVYKRYSEFVERDQQIRREIAPGKPADLPSKNRFAHLFKGNNPEFIDRRKSLLDTYIVALLNDPAFHCKSVFDFVRLDVDLERLWKRAYR